MPKYVKSSPDEQSLLKWALSVQGIYVWGPCYNQKSCQKLNNIVLSLTLLSPPHLSGPNMIVYGVLSWNSFCDWWNQNKLMLSKTACTEYLLISFLLGMFEGACSEILGKWIFLKLADMVTFPANISSMVKKLQICISFVNNLRKQCLNVTYCFINSGNHIF